MHGKRLNPIFLLISIILITSSACSTSSKVETATAPPSKILTLIPTYTTLPTYTRVPTRTRAPDSTISTPSSTTEAIVTPVVTATLPLNCTSSDTTGYFKCFDNTGSISVDIPNNWNEVDGASWSYRQEDIGYAISAAPNLSNYKLSYGSEGMFFGASETFAKYGGYVEFLDFYAAPYQEDCTWVGRYNYNDGTYRGKYDEYTDCGGPSNYVTYILSAVDIKNPLSKIILVEISIYETDTFIKKQIWSTFFVYF